MKQSKRLLRSLIAISILAVLMIGMLLIYNQFKPQGAKGSKEIVVEVVIPDEENTEVTLNTDAEFLRQALEEENMIKGTESDFGLFITEVNGRTVDNSKEEWWCITKDGATVEYGVDQIAIADGEHYEISLMSGY